MFNPQVPEGYAPLGYAPPPLGYAQQPPQYPNMQYGVQQLYPPLQPPPTPQPADNFGTTSIIMPILCCGGPMLLASIGLYCTVQGKVKNDIASLFYAGVVLLALAVVLFCISCVWICKHPPDNQSCLSAMMGINTCVQCWIWSQIPVSSPQGLPQT